VLSIIHCPKGALYLDPRGFFGTPGQQYCPPSFPAWERLVVMVRKDRAVCRSVVGRWLEGVWVPLCLVYWQPICLLGVQTL
jgi:hypothetical protein